MKIPRDAEILPRKLSEYLLVPRPKGDKSKFLAQAGFTSANADELMDSSRRLAIEAEATEDGVNEYGIFDRADGPLTGLDGRVLSVAIVWIRWHSDGSFHFVTWKPLRAARS